MPGTAFLKRRLDLPADHIFPVVRVKTAPHGPFLFRKRIEGADPAAQPGDIVRVHDARDQLVGYGLFNPRSEIVVRMLAGPSVFPDAVVWQAKFRQAVALRQDLLKLDALTNAYRLVHAEGDGLSGLVVDRYADVLSIEAFSLAMYERAEAIAGELCQMTGAKHWIVRPGPKMVGQEGLEAPVRQSEACPKQVDIRESGARFRIRFDAGHKTGFFCDQRDNRRRLAGFCEGRRVLDLCCYTGGFAVQAKHLGAAGDVTAVDLDEAAIDLARENANLNQLRIHFVHADAFAYMRDMLRGGKRYDVVVLDPPKLITNRIEYEDGERKHFDLNRLAISLVEPGGILLTCSCAGLLPAAEFERIVLSAARRTLDTAGEPHGRRVQILARAAAGPDHPIADNCPETDYLKAIWLRVL